jgi:hypothetical protein
MLTHATPGTRETVRMLTLRQPLARLAKPPHARDWLRSSLVLAPSFAPCLSVSFVAPVLRVDLNVAMNSHATHPHMARTQATTCCWQQERGNTANSRQSWFGRKRGLGSSALRAERRECDTSGTASPPLRRRRYVRPLFAEPFSKMTSESVNTRASRMLAVVVCSDLCARAEAAVAYAFTVSGVTGRSLGSKLKQRRGEEKPPARGYETTVVAMGRENAVGNVVVPGVAQRSHNPQGGASQAQRQDARPAKWDGHEPGVLVQAASLPDVVQRINEWCPTLPVVIIGHHSMDVTAVTHPNVMLCLCEDDSASAWLKRVKRLRLGRRGRRATLTSAMSSA